MFKTVKMCICDVCKKPMTSRIFRVQVTEINDSEMPIANSEYDGSPIDMCLDCLKAIKGYAATRNTEIVFEEEFP